jgi:hypothetical protein
MSENVGGIEYDVGFDLSKLLAGERQINSTINNVTNNFSKIESAVKPLAGLISAAFATAALTAFIKEVATVQRQFDIINAGLVTATGSTLEAAKAFKVLQDFAATTPYDLQQVTKAFNQLVNLGLTPSERALTSYGNTASAMGKDLSQMVEAVADAATGEFERLKEFGIKSKAEGDKVSFTFQNVKTTVGNNAREIEEYLTKLGENKFAGAMEQRAATLDGAISNLADTWGMLFLTISQSGIGDEISSMVRVAINVLGNLQQTIENETTQSVVGLDKESEALKRNNNIAKWSAQTIESLAGFADAIQVVWETISVLGRNLAFVFQGIGSEIGGIGAQASALARGDLAGAIAIGDEMKSSAAARRAELDAADAKTLAAKESWGDKMLATAKRIREEESKPTDTTDRLAQYGKGGKVDKGPDKNAEAEAKKLAMQQEKGYQELLRLRSAAATGLAKIDAQELDELDKINKLKFKNTEQYEEAKFLVAQKYAQDRVAFLESESDKEVAIQEKVQAANLEARNKTIDVTTKFRGLDPVTALEDEYKAKLEIVNQYEAEMAAAGVNASAEATATKLQIETDYNVAKQDLAIQTWAKQSEINQFTLDALDAFGSASSSAIEGLLTGTMSAQDAMRSLASSILNEAVGALVQVGVQYAKNQIIQQTADQAVAATKLAAIATTTTAQVASTGTMAATSTAAAGAVAAAAAPAAGLMSIATLGKAAVIGGSALIGTMALAKSFGGGRRYGGAVNSDSMYRVNESGAPEMFTANNGAQYMMPTSNGNVTPANQVGGGGGVTINISNYAGADIQTTTSPNGKMIEIAVRQAVQAVGDGLRSNTGPAWDGLKAGSNAQSKL